MGTGTETCCRSVTDTAPCHFLQFSAVRLGICEVSVVSGTSDFQRLFRGSQISAFLLSRFCSGFSGSGVRRQVGGGGAITFML